MLTLVLDSGATVSFIRLDVVKRLSLELLPNNQLAILADKATRLKSLGEIDILVVEHSTNAVVLRLRALVVNELGVEIYAGQTFHLDNGVVGDVSAKTISLHNGRFKIFDFGIGDRSPAAHPPPYLTINDEPSPMLSNICISEQIKTISSSKSEIHPLKSRQPESKSGTISIKNQKFLLPRGQYEIRLEKHPENKAVLIIPQPPKLPLKDHEFESPVWDPQICPVVSGNALYTNYSPDPLHHTNNVHFQVIELLELSMEEAMANNNSQSMMVNSASITNIEDLLSEVKVDRSIMSPEQNRYLDEILAENIRAFDDDLSVGYDNKSEPYEATFSFRKENKAPPYKVWAPQYNRKCQDLLQAKCDELEQQGVLCDPKQHGVDIRHVSPCFIQQKARAKHKPLETCDLSEIRFITCFNVLNESIHPVPGRSKTYNDILTFLGRFKFFIFADLYNSYFQIKVHKKHWKYLGIMTPHRGLKIMTRCGQGLLNSDVDLDQVLARVLGDDISAGYCLAARDDLFVGGDTIDEALHNWNSVLTKMSQNNLKVTARKLRVFLGDTEVFGHRITNGKVSPSNHNITSLAMTKIEDLKTVRQVNAWKGLYKTLIRHLPNLAHFMSPFDAACGGQASTSTFDWTKPGMLEAFNLATNQLQKVHETVLPQPWEQLYLLPDTSKSNLCTGWVLYTKRCSKNGDKLFPVQYASSKLEKYMATWSPCELEGVGVVLAIDQVRHWINESHLPTMVLADNKPVVDAANLMKMGRHSKNSRLQS